MTAASAAGARRPARHCLWTVALNLALLSAASAALAEPIVIDEFNDVNGWTSGASENASIRVSRDSGHNGEGMRIDFEIDPAGGYVMVHKAVNLSLPSDYSFRFCLRGEARPNNFEFKIVDASGQNVWWRRQPGYLFPNGWQCVSVKKARMEFAWGPSRGAAMSSAAGIEFGISSGEGGSGTIWIDDLSIEEHDAAANDRPPLLSSSSTSSGSTLDAIFDRDPATGWHSEASPEAQWVLIDFQREREFGGLIVDWDPLDYAGAYQVQTSSDGEHWTTAWVGSAGNGGRDYVYTPDAEARYLRLGLERSSRGLGYGIDEIVVQPLELSTTPNRFFAAIAREARRGLYPRYFQGEQTYWTIIGVDSDDAEALMNEDGLLETDKGSFSIEPFLWVDGKLLTWSDVALTPSLEDGYLPIPSVTWKAGDVELKVTGFATGVRGAASLYAIYRVENRGTESKSVRLFLTVRPFQVNPPWQSLNMVGGVSPIRELTYDGRAVRVNGSKVVVSLTPPDGFGAAQFEQGGVADFLARGELPPHPVAVDPHNVASGALAYDLVLPHGRAEEVYLAVPFTAAAEPGLAGVAVDEAEAFVQGHFEEARASWQKLLGRVELVAPASAAPVLRATRTALAHLLINRDGPAIQPGSRDYARSWIRDGALTSTSLLEMGCAPQVRAFLRWYAQYQFPDGKIPCCIDRRGADLVSEHDSAGEFIFAIAEYYRYTRDSGLVNDLWPNVVRAVDYLASLRRQRMTAEYRAEDKLAYFGLLPESISHEGYSAHPVHSYWDDFFALRGFKDAAMLAGVVGDEEHALTFGQLRDAFREDLYNSMARTMAEHHIDYLPASVELGDFDPSSTAIALVAAGETGNLPQHALRTTFERYYADFTHRSKNEVDWEAYTPYEFRNVAAFIRLGWRERALELFDWLFADRRPPAWNQWPEVSYRDQKAPNFIGDMPHGWVASTFINAVRTMFAYERDSDNALIIAAGIPEQWLDEGPVGVTRLPTHYGVLHYRLHRDGPDTLRLRLSGDIVMPPGKIVVVPPLSRPIRSATVNGTSVDAFAARSVAIRQVPAEVVIGY